MGLADHYGIAPAELHQMFLQALNYGFLIAGIFSISIVCVLIWWLVRKFVNPINDLSAQFKKISNGSYHVRAAPQSTPELAQLAGSFNTMANELEKQESLRRRLIADVAHELKTPLTNLKGTLEGIDDGLIQANADTLLSLTQEVDRLTKLVDEILDLARLESNRNHSQFTTLDLKAILLKSIKSFRPIFERKHLRVKLDSWPKNVRMIGDENKIYRVFENLFSNTCRFAPTGDRIICKFATCQASFVVKISNTAPEHVERDIDNLFQRFYRCDLSRSSEGSGLGLSIVKELIELHGGSVGATYGDNVITIWFRIPTIQNL